jgi:hypothetical protein
MATQWHFKAEYIKNCNCAPGCPCDFWAGPTNYSCSGMATFHILEGKYGDVPLGGLALVLTYHWPGSLHMGHGEVQPFISRDSSAEQRNALLTIASGKAGNAWFEVLASVIETVHEPKFVAIEWEFDIARRHARCAIPGELETVSEPIKNIVTGGTHTIRVEMPQGMEYRHPEIVTTRVLRSTGTIKFDCPPAHSSMAIVEHSEKGLVADYTQAGAATAA